MSFVDYLISLFPSSPFTYLIYIFLFTLISIGVIFLFPKKKSKNPSPKKEVSIKDLLDIVSNPNSTSDDLIMAIKLFNSYVKMDENLKDSFQFFDKLLTHKNRNKELFRYFYDVILPNNKKYKKELQEIEKRALDKGL